MKGLPKDKVLVAGIVDAQHPYKEQIGDLTGLVDGITKFVDPERLLLAPNTDLHFLPWDKAEEKVRKLVEFATVYRTPKVTGRGDDRVIGYRSWISTMPSSS